MKDPTMSSTGSKEMDSHEKIEGVLLSLPFVKWDRYTLDGELDEVHVYGWIDREKDAYKDFVLIKFVEGEVDSFATSSALRTHEIHKILGFTEGDHNECMRVDESFSDVPNATHLSASPETPADAIRNGLQDKNGMLEVAQKSIDNQRDVMGLPPLTPAEGWEKEYETLFPPDKRSLIGPMEFWVLQPRIKDFIRSTVATAEKKAKEEVVGKHNANILNEYQNQGLGDERVLWSVLTRATEITLEARELGGENWV